MKNAEIKKITEVHTNRLLVSVSVALSFLVILLLVNRGQSYSQTILQTQNIVSVISVFSAVAAVGLTVLALIKKKTYLVEYILLAAAMAFCFYCIAGVGFVTVKLMKYVTAVILVAYLVLAFVYHTIAPKFINK